MREGGPQRAVPRGGGRRKWRSRVPAGPASGGRGASASAVLPRRRAEPSAGVQLRRGVRNRDSLCAPYAGSNFKRLAMAGIKAASA